MRLTISKSKNAEQLYITKSIRVNKNKTTSKIIVKLGSMASLLPQHDNDRDKVIAWAKEQARLYTEAEKNNTLKVPVEFSQGKQIAMGERVTFNGGYLFLQKIPIDVKQEFVLLLHFFLFHQYKQNKYRI